MEKLAVVHFVAEESELALDGVDGGAQFLAHDADARGSFGAVGRLLDLKLDLIAALQKLFLVLQAGDSELVDDFIGIGCKISNDDVSK